MIIVLQWQDLLRFQFILVSLFEYFKTTINIEGILIKTSYFSCDIFWWTKRRRELELGMGIKYKVGKTHWLHGVAS